MLPDNEKVVFGQTIESLLKSFAPFSASELVVLESLKIHPDKPVWAAYPLATHIALMELIAKSRFSHLPDIDAFTEIGRQFIGAYEKTLTGKALMAAMRLIGPKRVLARLTRTLKTGNNYSEGSVTELGPTEAEVRFNYVIKPGFYRGLLLAGLRVAGAKNLAVDYVRHDGNAALFRLKWDA